MVKFIKVNVIPTHEVLIIPVENMIQIVTGSAGETQVKYRTGNGDINIIAISHSSMPSSADTSMIDWVTKQFIEANQRPWSEPMYNVSASDAPYSISNIVLS